MFSKSNIYFRIIPTVLIFLTIGFLMNRANDGVAEGISIGRVCVGWGWEDRPRSDVVFVGTSRSFRAIDIVELNQMLERSNSPYKSADLVWTLGPAIAPKIDSFLSYLDNGQAPPKVLIIENSFRQKGIRLEGLRLHDDLVLMKGHKRYFRLDHLSYLTDQIDKKYDRNFWSKFSADYVSKYDQMSEKMSLTFYDFLSKPSMIFNPRRKACDSEFQKWNLKHNKDPKISGTKTVNKKRHIRLNKQIQKYAPLRPDHERREYEVNLTNILIETAKEKGVEKVYVWQVADYGLSYSEEEHEAFQKVYPKADYVFYGEIVNLLIDTGIRKQDLFRDVNHVNKTSRKVITDFWYSNLTGGPKGK